MPDAVSFPQNEKNPWGKRVQNGKVTIQVRERFALDETLACGQCFRWERTTQGWSGTAYGKRLQIEQNGDCLQLDTTPEEFEEIWYDYFDLGTDYEAIRGQLCGKQERLCDMAAYAPGIRILRQDAWEALLTFLLSQNNNIPRITGIVRRLCERYGERIADGYAFPDAQRMAALSEQDLRDIGSGFRAKYLLAAAKMVAGGELDLESLRTLELGRAREVLRTVPGIGPKVAECVLLYGLHRLEAFPMDVWMKRAMEEFFPGCTPGIFGEYAGIAQQYLYHYVRTRKNQVDAGRTRE